MIRILATLAALTCLALAGCGGLVQDERIDGPYRLIAIDADEQMRVCYDLGKGDCIGRVPETVFAVGWNEAYVVAASHPHEFGPTPLDRSKTEYFYIVRSLDGASVDPSVAVRGPFEKSAFETERRRLALPRFTREIASLK